MICPITFLQFKRYENGLKWNDTTDCVEDLCAWWVRQEAKDLTVPPEIKPAALIGGCAIKILVMRRYDGHTNQDK